MSADRELTRIVRSWLDEDVAAFPDRVLDAALDQIHATHQRRPWPAWRAQPMSLQLRLAIAAAAVVAIAVVGINLWPDSQGPGGPTPSPSPIRTPQASASSGAAVRPLRDGPLTAGTYQTQPFVPLSTIRFTFDVPEGYTAFGNSGLSRDDVGFGPPNGMALAFLGVGDLYSDPCNGTAGDVDTGTTVGGLTTALASQGAYEVSGPDPIELAGFSGQLMTLTLPSDLDFSTCTNDGGDPAARAANVGGFFVWQSDQSGGSNVYAQGPGNRFHLWILDVNGARRVVLTHDFAGTTPQHRAELQAILDSIVITP